MPKNKYYLKTVFNYLGLTILSAGNRLGSSHSTSCVGQKIGMKLKVDRVRMFTCLALIVSLAINACSPHIQPPTAFIDHINPAEAVKGEPITFNGHGIDPDGEVVSYDWTSSLCGQISTSASFKISSLPVGSHDIFFRVEDDTGAWSVSATSTVVVVEKGTTSTFAASHTAGIDFVVLSFAYHENDPPTYRWIGQSFSLLEPGYLDYIEIWIQSRSSKFSRSTDLITCDFRDADGNILESCSISGLDYPDAGWQILQFEQATQLTPGIYCFTLYIDNPIIPFQQTIYDVMCSRDTNSYPEGQGYLSTSSYPKIWGGWYSATEDPYDLNFRLALVQDS